jgi:hypothetical protein
VQPHLINRLIEKFGYEVKGIRAYRTPGTPRFKIVGPDCDSEPVNKGTQQRYHSGVGIQDQILATLLESYQSAWMELQWVLTLKC